jgi:hypothetical protein
MSEKNSRHFRIISAPHCAIRSNIDATNRALDTVPRRLDRADRLLSVFVIREFTDFCHQTLPDVGSSLSSFSKERTAQRSGFGIEIRLKQSHILQ